MLARWRPQPIKDRIRGRQQIAGRLQNIRLKSCPSYALDWIKVQTPLSSKRFLLVADVRCVIFVTIYSIIGLFKMMECISEAVY